jgi:hypothetical protein
MTPCLFHVALMALGRHRDSRHAMYENTCTGSPYLRNRGCHSGHRISWSAGIGLRGVALIGTTTAALPFVPSAILPSSWVDAAAGGTAMTTPVNNAHTTYFNI